VYLLNSNNNEVTGNTYEDCDANYKDEGGTGNNFGVTPPGDGEGFPDYASIVLITILIVIGAVIGVFAVLYKVYPEKMQSLGDKFKGLSKNLRPEKGSEKYGKFTLSGKSLPIKRKKGPVVITDTEKKLVAEKPKSIPTPDHKPKPKPVAKPKPATKPEPKKEAPKPEPKPKLKPAVKTKQEIKPALDEEALQKKFKEATGKNAIWRGAETKAYKDWKQNQ